MIASSPWFAIAMVISFCFILQVDVSSSFSPLTFSLDKKTSLSWPYPSQQQRQRHLILAASMSNDDSSSLNMDGLRKRMQRQENQYAALLMEQVNYAIEDEDNENRRIVPESVHIILFHPDTPQQHVHTIEFPKSSGNNIILAFESGVDCVNFARMLQDLEFVDPSPEETIFEPFRQYCEMSGLSLMIVPKGFELTPPQINANDKDDEDNEDIDEVDDVIVDDTMVEGVVTDDNDLDAWG